jgi:hypothetical protein
MKIKYLEYSPKNSLNIKMSSGYNELICSTLGLHYVHVFMQVRKCALFEPCEPFILTNIRYCKLYACLCLAVVKCCSYIIKLHIHCCDFITHTKITEGQSLYMCVSIQLKSDIYI